MDRAPPAFRAIYEAEIAYVARTLRRLGVAAADVEDVAHDVFVVAYRRLADYDPGRPLRPWLFGIALRVTSHHFERAHRRNEIPTDGAGEGAPDAGRVGTDDARDVVLRALETVDLDHRAVCVLHDLEGYSAPEIAATLEVPVATVYSRLRNGRQKIAAAVRRLQRGMR